MLGQPRDGDGQPASGADPLDRLPGPVRSRAAEEQAFGSLRVGQPLELTGQPGPGLRSPIDLEPGREGHSGAAEPDAGVGAEAVGHFPASTEGGLALPVHLPALSPGGAQEGASEVDDGQAVREYAVLQATDGRPAHQGAAGGGEDVNADGAARSGRRPPLPEGALRGASVGGPWGLGRSPVIHRTQVAIRSPGRSAVRQTEQLVDT